MQYQYQYQQSYCAMLGNYAVFLCNTTMLLCNCICSTASLHASDTVQRSLVWSVLSVSSVLLQFDLLQQLGFEGYAILINTNELQSHFIATPKGKNFHRIRQKQGKPLENPFIGYIFSEGAGEFKGFWHVRINFDMLCRSTETTHNLVESLCASLFWAENCWLSVNASSKFGILACD